MSGAPVIDDLGVADEIAAGIPTTPCPPWCQKPAGHPWKYYGYGPIVRSHSARFGATEVTDIEEFDLDTGATTERYEPTIDAGDWADIDGMTPEAAEELAAQLLAAAAYFRAAVTA